MKVIFLKNVLHVWKAGDIKEVKSGYASNFLLPKWLAVKLTPEVEKNLIYKTKREEANKRELIENRHNIVEKLNLKSLQFSLKTWSNGKVYGWIWEKDIIREIKKNFSINLSKKHINLENGHIKKVWEENVYIKLWKDAIAKIIVIIKSLDS